MDDEWFRCDVDVDGASGYVLHEVRRGVADHGLGDVPPERTRAYYKSGKWPLVLVVRAPGLDDIPGSPELQVEVIPEEGPDDTAVMFMAWETFGWVVDAPTEMRECPDSEPKVLAFSAIAWLQQELGRPIVRWEWDTWTGRTKRLWRFDDTGEELMSSGFLWHRRRTTPTRVVAIR